MGGREKGTAETRRTRTTKQAFQEIKDIKYFFEVTCRHPSYAIRVTEAIREMIGKIGANPYLFKECDHLPTKSKIYRQANCLSYLIIYKITKTEVIILKVTHSARNPSEIRKLRGNY